MPRCLKLNPKYFAYCTSCGGGYRDQASTERAVQAPSAKIFLVRHQGGHPYGHGHFRAEKCLFSNLAGSTGTAIPVYSAPLLSPRSSRISAWGGRRTHDTVCRSHATIDLPSWGGARIETPLSCYCDSTADSPKVFPVPGIDCRHAKTKGWRKGVKRLATVACSGGESMIKKKRERDHIRRTPCGYGGSYNSRDLHCVLARSSREVCVPAILTHLLLHKAERRTTDKRTTNRRKSFKRHLSDNVLGHENISLPAHAHLWMGVGGPGEVVCIHGIPVFRVVSCWQKSYM